MRKKALVLTTLLSFSSSPLLLFAGDYINYPYYYFSAGYDYGKYLKVQGEMGVNGYAIVIPVKDEKTFAYYHFLLTKYGYKPVAIKGAVVAKVAKDKQLLTKDLEIIRDKLKFPAKIEKVDAIGYTFTLDRKSGKTSQAKTQISNPQGNKEGKNQTAKLPIDEVIEDLQKAIKDAKKIGEVEPPKVRAIYRIEFDKEKLLRDLREILKGLKEFKEATKTQVDLN